MKITDTGLPGDVGERLLDLRRVAVRADGVGATRSRCTPGSGSSSFGVRPAAGHAALAVDDDAGQLDQPVRHQRGEAEDRRLRVAAGVGDELRAVDVVAVQLRQPVNRVGEIRGVVVRLLVPLLVNVRRRAGGSRRSDR